MKKKPIKMCGDAKFGKTKGKKELLIISSYLQLFIEFCQIVEESNGVCTLGF